MSRSTTESQALGTGSDAASWRAVLAKSIRQPFVWSGTQRRIRRDIDALMALNDRMLADIGLSRGEILYAARHGSLPKRGANAGDRSQP
jgi:uncharacterized protein YjiS (DUF1127 family)